MRVLVTFRIVPHINGRRGQLVRASVGVNPRWTADKKRIHAASEAKRIIERRRPIFGRLKLVSVEGL